jgi:NAD(P)-dependent dehydrogenase (short-subunit alcohol dehydrogenase family)
MAFLDAILDTTLLGYSKIGFSSRRLSVDEPFPSLMEKHVMVTGATGGIGHAAVQRFASNGAIVHAVGRNRRKLDELVKQTEGRIVPHIADLSLMEDNSRLASAFIDLGEPLYGLVNNVGVMSPKRVTTAEGFELTYATNLLGQFVLTRKLVAGLGLKRPTRIVFVSSGGMYTQELTATNLESVDGEYNGAKAYARTKRGQVVLASQLADTTGAPSVVTSMHPGWVDTDGVKASLPTFQKITRPILRDAPQGADTMVWLVGSMQAADLNGEFVHDRLPRPKHRLGRTQVVASVTKEFMTKLESDAKPYLR